MIVSKTLSINAVLLPETLFPLSLTFAHSSDDGKMNIAMSVKDQMYDIMEYFDLIRTECGDGLLSTR
jgi:hypothetical protein